MKTFEKLVFLRRNLRIFLVHRKVIFHSLDNLFFIFWTIASTLKVLVSWGRVHFSKYPLNRKSFGYETWPGNRFGHGQIIVGNILQEFRAIYQLTTINQKVIMISFVVFYSSDGVDWLKTVSVIH